MKTEYDFSKGVRGKFNLPEAVFNFPVYLEPDVAAFLDMLAEKKQTDIQALVNEWLRATFDWCKARNRGDSFTFGIIEHNTSPCVEVDA